MKKTKICIICPIHGEFWQMPYNHLNGNGCKQCASEKSSKRQKMTTEEFIEKAKKIHGNKYDYSKTDLNKKDEKGRVCIVCPIHGEFWQVPTTHLSNHGCPKCKTSKLEKEIISFLKENNIQDYTYNEKYSWLNGLQLDFYLPQYNCAIECQGKQHFGLGNFGSKRFNYEEEIRRDKLKFDLCKEQGIKLLYFSNLHINYPYKVYEDKEELLKEITNEFNGK